MNLDRSHVRVCIELLTIGKRVHHDYLFATMRPFARDHGRRSGAIGNGLDSWLLVARDDRHLIASRRPAAFFKIFTWRWSSSKESQF